MGASASLQAQKEHLDVLPFDPSIFPKDGVSLSSLHDFYDACGGREQLVGLSTTDVCVKFIMPQTSVTKSSYCEYMKTCHHPGVGPANVFISHAWRYQFLDVISALQWHFRDQPDIIIWFDLFSNNQHQAVSLPYDWWATTFKSAIKDFQHMVMVLSPWHDPIPYTRAWCIFEAYCCAVTNSKFEIAMSEENRQHFLLDMEEEPQQKIDKLLGTIQAERSECWMPADRDSIFAVIIEEIGFGKLNAMVFEQYRTWVIDVTKQALEENSANEEKRAVLTSILATLYQGQGDYAQSKKMFEICRDIKLKLFGENHPGTLLTLNDLGSLLRSKGEWDEAEVILKKCLDLRIESLGEKHRDTLITMNNYGCLLRNKGSFHEAEKTFRQCWELRKIELGEEHPDTLTSMNYVALALENQKQFEESSQIYSQCLELRKANLGEDHPETLKTYNNLGSLYRHQKEYDEATRMYEKCLSLRKVKLGDDNPDTLRSLNNLGCLKREMKLYPEAKSLLEECLRRRTLVLGHSHQDTLRTMNTVARLYGDTNDFNKSREMLEACLKQQTDALGESHPDTLSTMKDIANLPTL